MDEWLDEMKGNAKEASAPKTKLPVLQIVSAVIACLSLLLVLTVAVWWSIIGIKSFGEGMAAISQLFNPTQATTINPSALPENNAVFQNRDQVVATMGDVKLTNGELQIYYWTGVYDFLKENSSYIYYMGLSLNVPFSEQPCYLINQGTWQDYFLDAAWDAWHKFQAMALEADAVDLKLPADLQEVLDNLEKNMNEAAKENGLASADAMVQADYGPGCTFADYASYMNVYCKGYAYFNSQINLVDVSDEALEAYFTENKDGYAEQGITKDSGNYYYVRHILIAVDGDTDEAWENCRVEAQNLLDQWLAGDATEETFAEFANKYSDDNNGNVTNGGLYSQLTKGTNFVAPFKEWYLDENNQVGAYGLVKTSYGYHLMYQSNIRPIWKVECESDIYEDATIEIMDRVTKAHPIEIYESRAMIGNVSFG